ncbi:hypothetical protein KC678_04075 [Candidatus Dojkabacteria bacterium]|uniref:Uncharacterized protein n=1 Tax=Candidatus Dojkabacteria bacterium TaxID=2099670 RepID=A0A955RGG0_9BACT|nr:hypothetical protein [Candidatus Dojkabacteria bacterium]
MKLTNKRVDIDSLYEIITLGKGDAHFDARKQMKGTIVSFVKEKYCIAYDSPGWYRAWFKIIALGKNDSYNNAGELRCFGEVRLKKLSNE